MAGFPGPGVRGGTLPLVVCVCVSRVCLLCVCVCVCVCVIVGGQPSVDLAMNYSVPKSKSYRVFNRRLPFGPNLHERIVTPL